MRCEKCGRPAKVMETRTVYGGFVIRRASKCTVGHNSSSYEIPATLWKLAEKSLVRAAKRSASLLKKTKLLEVKELMMADRLQGMTCVSIAAKYSVPLSTARFYTRLPRAKIYPAVKKRNADKLKN